ncbi:MAG: DUF2723 domain-containing protein [Candidatus Eisenbacteria bacterium]|uniref:DUF2723 domain-containing protein n=1 Tax=Eiseniibacteriota bacterium TaxID=2212470 RepID=A0A538SSF8_UNCEI|nr:MAG: DUF2723 domain-containing protein [Candidatus Eisenbacteria bacterium]
MAEVGAKRFHLFGHSGVDPMEDRGIHMRWTRAGAGSLAAAAIAAFVYGSTLAPSVGAGDSGELILAAQSMGIPHPPGYPLWVLLARAAAVLPWGTVAFRVNALSAVLSACAVGLFYLLAARCGLRKSGRFARRGRRERRPRGPTRPSSSSPAWRCSRIRPSFSRR